MQVLVAVTVYQSLRSDMMIMMMIDMVILLSQVKLYFEKVSDLTTYGALSCELAFLQSFAICFTLVDQSGERIVLLSMTILLIDKTFFLQLKTKKNVFVAISNTLGCHL